MVLWNTINCKGTYLIALFSLKSYRKISAMMRGRGKPIRAFVDIFFVKSKKSGI